MEKAKLMTGPVVETFQVTSGVMESSRIESYRNGEGCPKEGVKGVILTDFNCFNLITKMI